MGAVGEFGGRGGETNEEEGVRSMRRKWKRMG